MATVTFGDLIWQHGATVLKYTYRKAKEVCTLLQIVPRVNVYRPFCVNVYRPFWQALLSSGRTKEICSPRHNIKYNRKTIQFRLF